MPSIADQLAVVLDKIQTAAASRSDILSKDSLSKDSLSKDSLSKKSPSQNISLIAVSKTKPIELLLEAYDAGMRLFGENKVQEARDKRPLLPEDAKIHLIGPLQKNKAKYCPALFSCIHTLHRLDVAEALEKKCAATGTTLDVLIQMNLSGEESKSGLTDVSSLQQLSDQVLALPHLKLTGLMTIGDPNLDEKGNRKLFSQLRELKDKEAARLGLQMQFKELSMGMSSDYEIAIEEGATLVRVGSAIFGSRNYA